jgi:LmbE family N-acetylglucosaminyl deacetylase
VVFGSLLSVATVLFFHAHPDDEAIATGGTMAKMAADGHRVVLVTATRGELGESPEGFLEPGESLAERREKELEAACEVLGVSRHEYLGYLDSGMEGEPTNEDPSCFWKADVEEAAERLARILVEEDVTALSIYDERGVYGHPDHVQVHRVGMRAAEIARTARVFMATVNQDHLRRVAEMAGELGQADQLADFEEQRSQIATLGVEEARITTAVDVTAFIDVKRRAMASHASQISETSFFLAMPPEAFAMVWGTESYIRVGAERQQDLERSLLDPEGTPHART